jgi:transposase
VEHIGIDVHKRESQICILDPDTGAVEERRIQTRAERYAVVLGPRRAAHVLIEAGTESEWVATCLEGLGHQVVVADPGYAPMYPRRGRRQKTDQRDARALAEASARGTYRAVHRVSAAQRQVRQHLAVRDTVVRTRTRHIALVRALVRSTGQRLPPGHAGTVGPRLAAMTLPPDLTTVLAPLQTLLTAVDTALGAADAALATAVADDPIVRLLQTVPGVGPVTSAAIRATLDTPTRFANARAASSYLGVVPCAHDSGDRRQGGHISKAGSSRARWLLVQVAWLVLRSPNPDLAPLRRWAERLAQRRGRRIAVVALARRLARILYAMWRDGQPFDGARLACSRAARPAGT